MKSGLSMFAGKRVTVMGLGQFGGGLSVVQWLCTQGARVLLTDLQTESELTDSLQVIHPLIQSNLVTLRLGEHREEDFAETNGVVANPAVPKPWLNPYLLAAQNAGVAITSEIRLACEHIDRNRVIGVTGTAGKSTTAAMIHHVLKRLKIPVHLGGNIGGSLLNSLDNIARNDLIVLELSSAMLYWLGQSCGYPEAQGWSPHIAVLTNLSPNHLDWHCTFEHYSESKQNIFRYQITGDHALCGDGERNRQEHTSQIPLGIPGEHNQANARLALLAVERATCVSAQQAAQLLRDFRGLPHRLQLVAEYDNLRFYNDSKATTPEATALAVTAFDDPSRIHLIAGGYDKGIDLAPIAQLANNVAGLYAIGATGQQLVALAPRATDCSTIDEAVRIARKRMKPGDILLLSPGCASWDQFPNYERRGEAFVRLVT